MPEIPAENYSPAWQGGTRTRIPRVGDERLLLTSFLDWHRETFELKCRGVPRERMSERSVPPSRLSLHGLVRHLAGVERWWFQIQLAGLDVPMLHYSDDDPDQDFERLDGDVETALAQWQAECDRSREIVAGIPTLEHTGVESSSGEPVSLRWVLVDLVAEYARHNGHADLLRERIDGAIGL